MEQVCFLHGPNKTRGRTLSDVQWRPRQRLCEKNPNASFGMKNRSIWPASVIYVRTPKPNRQIPFEPQITCTRPGACLSLLERRTPFLSVFCVHSGNGNDACCGTSTKSEEGTLNERWRQKGCELGRYFLTGRELVTKLELKTWTGVEAKTHYAHWLACLVAFLIRTWLGGQRKSHVQENVEHIDLFSRRWWSSTLKASSDHASLTAINLEWNIPLMARGRTMYGQRLSRGVPTPIGTQTAECKRSCN